MTPGEAAHGEHRDEAEREEQRGLEAGCEPPQSVPIQLKIFTPVGTAISMVESEKAASATGPMPAENMWWLQTPKPRKPMMMPEKITTGEPKSGLREKIGRTSDTMPIAGRIRM